MIEVEGYTFLVDRELMQRADTIMVSATFSGLKACASWSGNREACTVDDE